MGWWFGKSRSYNTTPLTSVLQISVRTDPSKVNISIASTWGGLRRGVQGVWIPPPPPTLKFEKCPFI